MTRVVGLLGQAILVVIGVLPGLGSPSPAATAPPAAPSTPLAVAPAPAATNLALAGSGAATLAATASTRSPADAQPGPMPLRFGAVHATPKASWIPSDGQVNALATDGTYVYLGGTFTALTNPANGQVQPHAGLARVNLATGVADSTWSPSVVGTVYALAYRASTSTLFVGGLFTSVNGTARTNLAAVSATGSGAVGSLNPAPDDEVRAMVLDGSKLVVGGLFNTITGVTQHRLARLDPSTGANDTGFTPNVSGGGVLAIVRPPGSSNYVIGGAFTLINGQAHSFLGQVSVSTGSVLSWAPSFVCSTGVKCPVLGLAADGTSVYAAIAGPGGQTAAYDLSSGQRRWVVASDGNAQAVALYAGELYVGGHFNVSFGGQLRRTLAAVDARTGALDPGFRPAAQSTFPGTEAMLTTSVGIVSGGAQLAIGGTAQSRLAIFPKTASAATANDVPQGLGPGFVVRRTLGSMR
jgi:Domain of unknown function (DUF5122) beta-propeller